MPARKHTQWLAEPSIEYVDSRIYSDWGIFNQEQEKIFKKCWIPLCHESELENHFNIHKILVFLAGIIFIILSQIISKYSSEPLLKNISILIMPFLISLMFYLFIQFKLKD